MTTLLHLDDPERRPTIGYIVEARTASVNIASDWLQPRHAWPGLMALGKVTASGRIRGTIKQETRYSLLS